MRKKNMVTQVDTSIFDVMRCVMSVGMEMIQTTIREDLEDDPKVNGLLDIVKAVCDDAINYGEQMTYVINAMAAQNSEILKKVEMLESKMK